MAEHGDGDTRRVVKKVVKKTVVRPLQQQSAAPRVPTTRLTAPSRARTNRPSSSSPLTATPRPSPAKAKTKGPVTRKPKWAKRSISVPQVHLPQLRLGERLRSARHAITDLIADAWHATIDVLSNAWHWLIGLRLPHLPPFQGSAITGLLVGLFAVGLGWCVYQLFWATLGTSAGHAYGFVAIVVLAFIAFVAAELLLWGFGVPHGRVIAVLAELIVLFLVLSFFNRLAAGVWAWLLIPTLSMLAFVAANAMADIAATTQNDQRLPWEPTKESHINTD